MTYTEARTWLITAASKAHQFEVVEIPARHDPNTNTIVPGKQSISACSVYVRVNGVPTKDINLALGCSCGATGHNMLMKAALQAITGARIQALDEPEKPAKTARILPKKRQAVKVVDPTPEEELI